MILCIFWFLWSCYYFSHPGFHGNELMHILPLTPSFFYFLVAFQNLNKWVRPWKWSSCSYYISGCFAWGFPLQQHECLIVHQGFLAGRHCTLNRKSRQQSGIKRWILMKVIMKTKLFWWYFLGVTNPSWWAGTRAPGHQGTRAPGHQGTRTPGHQDTRAPGHQDTRAPGHQDTTTPRHHDTIYPGSTTRASWRQRSRAPGHHST